MRRFLRVIVCAVAVLAVAAPATAAASEPVVSTGTATAITSTSATLNGTVNPEGQATSYYFQYGTTTSYGSETATAAAGSGAASVNVSVPIASLAPQTTYHHRLVATNASGTSAEFRRARVVVGPDSDHAQGRGRTARTPSSQSPPEWPQINGTSGKRRARSATSSGVDSPAGLAPPGRRGSPPTSYQA